MNTQTTALRTQRFRATATMAGTIPLAYSKREVLFIVGLLMLALAVRFTSVVGPEDSTWVIGSCDDPFVDETAPILATGNPFHFPVFFYPPVAPMIVATNVGVWRVIGGGGELAPQCRIITLMFSVATVGLVYLLGRIWGRSHAFTAALFYAVTMMPVIVQGNVQVYSTFFLVLSLYIALRDDAGTSRCLLCLVGVSLGLGIASKYSPLFFSGILFIPYLLRRISLGNLAPRLASADRPKTSGLPSTAWLVALTVVTAAGWLMLGVGIANRPFIYGLLEAFYNQRMHANPFAHHLPLIARVYDAGLLIAGVTGTGAALLLAIPWIRGTSSLQWAQQVYARHIQWMLPVTCMIVTLAIALALPAVLNIHDFARYFSFIAKAMASGDNGMFPESHPAVSYIAGFIPESIGLPLFIAGLVGLPYAVLARDRRLIAIIACAIPAYAMLELSRVKINRYALEMFPVWCLLAAIWLGDLWQKRGLLWRSLTLATTIGIAAYSLAYTLAWAAFFAPGNDIQRAAGRWLNRTIPPGSSIGVRSGLLVTGSPELLPPSHFLAQYQEVDYRDRPQYVLLPNGVYAIVLQYMQATRDGYSYTANDWFPSTPSPQDLETLTRLVAGDDYELVREFRRRPAIWGIDLESDSLAGPTWLVEHSPPSGLRVYRRLTR